MNEMSINPSTRSSIVVPKEIENNCVVFLWADLTDFLSFLEAFLAHRNLELIRTDANCVDTSSYL